MMPDEQQVDLIKVLLPYFNENTQLQDYESLWAFKISDGIAKLDNIPFLAGGYADDDVIRYETRNGMNVVIGLEEPSGHSCIQIIFFDTNDTQGYRDKLLSMGCGSEGGPVPGMIAVDIPPNVDYYSIIRPFLDAKEDDGVLGYREACLGQ